MAKTKDTPNDADAERLAAEEAERLAAEEAERLAAEEAERLAAAPEKLGPNPTLGEILDYEAARAARSS
jgi:hypothetical protein